MRISYLVYFSVVKTLSLLSVADGFTTVSPAPTRTYRSRNSELRFSLQTSSDKIAYKSAKVSDPWLVEETTSTSSSTATTTETYDPLNLADASSYGPDAKRMDLASASTAASEATTKENQGELTLWAARGILLIIAALWGTNFACVKYLNDLCFHPPCNHPPSEFAFARFGIAALASVPLLLKQRRDVIMAGFECGLWITLGYVSQSMALASISAGECAFICSLTVVFVPIVSMLLYGQPLKVKDLVAGAIAISGVAVLEGMVDVRSLLGIAPALAAARESIATTAASAVSSSSLETAAAAATAGGEPLGMLAHAVGVTTGDLVALGQPMGFGFAFTRIEHYQEKFRNVPNRVLTIAASQCVMVGILSFFWLLYDYDGVIPNFEYMIEPHRIATLAWTGIVTTLVAIYMEGIALQKASATDASIAFASEPVWASLFGFILLGETLGFNAYAGGSIIMAACLIGALADLKDEDKEEQQPPSLPTKES
ncbi:hypothetical protein ACA910_009065 [Epithemia clementina (nom. ined.)]